MTATEKQKIKITAYRILTGRDYSSAKIEQKLLDKGFSPDNIAAVLEELRQEGSLNDRRFVESYLHARKSQGYGPHRIRQELLKQGISKDLIEEQLDIADNIWFAEVKRVWQKRFKSRLPADLSERAKHCRFLQYRGFTAEQIEHIFDLDDSDAHANTTYFN